MKRFVALRGTFKTKKPFKTVGINVSGDLPPKARHLAASIPAD